MQNRFTFNFPFCGEYSIIISLYSDFLKLAKIPFKKENEEKAQALKSRSEEAERLQAEYGQIKSQHEASLLVFIALDVNEIYLFIHILIIPLRVHFS